MEWRLTTTGMIELPRFEECFRKYDIEWIMKGPKKCREIFVHEFYAAYKGKLKRQNP